MRERAHEVNKETAKKTQVPENNVTDDFSTRYTNSSWIQPGALASASDQRIDPSSLTPAIILQLQRTIGNQAVLHLTNLDKREPLSSQTPPSSRNILVQTGDGKVDSIQQVHHPTSDKPGVRPNFTTIGRGRVLQLDRPDAVCGPDIAVDGNLLAFTQAFNQEFRTILHMFEPLTSYGGSAAGEASASAPEGSSQEGVSGEVSIEIPRAEAPHARGDRRAGTQSGNEVDPCTLRHLFTETQREKLMSFFQGHQIPDRLFNGDDVGHTTAQQRLLMSAHILANGTYRPGSFDQRVHARMCFHWVHIVHHYAGATPTGILSRGVMGNFDQEGNIILGAGSSEQVFAGSRVGAAELPQEEAGGIGPVPAGTGHATSMAQDPGRVHRRHSLPFARFGEIQPGDWLWYYNANRSAGGSHSVIFSRWASGEQEAGGFRYRAAVCFSQGSPEGGGREHNVNLGEAFVRQGGVAIYPITYVSRVNQEAGPAQTVGELLPQGSARSEERLQGANQTYLRRIERRYRRPVDLQIFMNHLRTENRGHIAAISGRLTEGQRNLLNEANRTDRIETLIRLTQRLRMLANNSALLERNMQRTYTERLNIRHAEVSERVTREQQRIEGEMQEIDDEMGPVEEQIEELNRRQSALDPSPRIRELSREAGRIWNRLRSMSRRHPDHAALRARRQEILAQISELQGERRGNRREIIEIRQQIQALRRQIRPLTNRRRRLERQLARQQTALPYGLVHPGSLGSQDMSRSTGRIQDLFTINQMREFLVPESVPIFE